nr:unnamed protein product [Digitaria exilis]
MDSSRRLRLSPSASPSVQQRAERPRREAGSALHDGPGLKPPASPPAAGSRHRGIDLPAEDLVLDGEPHSLPGARQMTNVGASSSGTAAIGKGKGVSRASTITIGAATKTARTQSTKTNTSVQVVCEDGKVVKLKGPTQSESAPTLDEDVDSEPGEPNNPSEFVVEELGMDEEEVVAFKEDIFGKTSGKKRKQRSEEEDSANDSESDHMQRSPPYAESGDSSSDDGGDVY